MSAIPSTTLWDEADPALLRGLTVLGAYTFSKSTDNGSGIRTLGTDPLNPQDSYCLSCEDGPSVFDQRHRFVTSVVYDLPIGPNRKYLSEGALGKVIGGWKVTSVVTIGSGFPLDDRGGRRHRQHRQLLQAES